MQKILTALFSALLFFYFACWRLPLTQPLQLEPLPARSSAILLPLDGRPVCSVLPQQLGELAGIKVIVPPAGFLDNYARPAEREKLYLWLKDHLQGAEQAIISADLLIHGGLIASRLPLGGAAEEERFMQTLARMGAAAPETAFSVFSIVPRLLVSDQLTPDSWYQWQLMRRAPMREMTETFGDPGMTVEQERLAARIPPQILHKYLELYRGNDAFNKRFAVMGGANVVTVIGQDDGEAFGLPNRNLNRARLYGAAHPGSYTTYGADEIAAVLLAREYLRRHDYRPKIFCRYAAPDMEFMYMPFMAASVGETLRDKIRLLGAEEAACREEADIIAYINCGSAGFQPGREQAEELRSLLESGQKIALIDLAAGFQTEELLMPLLLRRDVPVHRLAAYAGWNTFSNSAGTALAQAAVFAGRCRELQAAELPRLYAVNLQLVLTRLLDDYVYQKTWHAHLKQQLLARGVNPENLNERGRDFAWYETRAYLTRVARELLHYNLGRAPFYSADGTEYYVRDVRVASYLPWNRIFETGLDVTVEIGIRTRH